MGGTKARVGELAGLFGEMVQFDWGAGVKRESGGKKSRGGLAGTCPGGAQILGSGAALVLISRGDSPRPAVGRCDCSLREKLDECKELGGGGGPSSRRNTVFKGCGARWDETKGERRNRRLQHDAPHCFRH